MDLATVFKWAPTIDWTGVGTILLAGATAVLAGHTRTAARAAAAEVKANQRPILVPKEIHGDVMGVTIDVRNIRPGPALDIYGTYRGKDQVIEPIQPVTALGASEVMQLTFQLRPMTAIAQSLDHHYLVLEYKDVTGKDWHTIGSPKAGGSLRIFIQGGWAQTETQEGKAGKS